MYHDKTPEVHRLLVLNYGTNQIKKYRTVKSFLVLNTDVLLCNNTKLTSNELSTCLEHCSFKV